MEKPKAPFSLHKRPTKNKNRNIYYVQFRNQDGEYTSALSTGHTSKSAAKDWATEYLKRGHVPTKRGFTFENYSRDWWIWEKCNYIKGKLARGMTLSRRYIDESRRNLDKHLIPYFGNRKLTDIKPIDIESWLIHQYETSGLSPATVNRVLATLKVMMKEAERLGYVREDPAKNIGILKENPKEKTILTLDEIRQLFDESRTKTIWNGDEKHFTLNLLAATTGMRMGEVQGLVVKNVHEYYISVTQSWSRKYGLKDPKWQSNRQIPIPRITRNHLDLLISQSPYSEPVNLVFFGTDNNKPVGHKIILQRLYLALIRVGISEE